MLCSHENVTEQELSTFLQCLLDSGYDLTTLIPLFIAADNQASKHQVPQQKNPRQPYGPQPLPIANNQLVFFHLQYHPLNPTT